MVRRTYNLKEVVILKALTIAVRAFKVLQTSDLTLMNLIKLYCYLYCFKCTRLLQIILGINTKNPPSIYLVIHLPALSEPKRGNLNKHIPSRYILFDALPIADTVTIKKRNRQHYLKNRALHHRAKTTILRASTTTTRPESELHPKQQTSWPVKQNGLFITSFYSTNY